MSDWQLKTPVVLIIFNRPDTTEKVFRAIARAKPPKLLVIADGPRADQSGEAEKCTATRAIIEQVDWQCEVLRDYSDINLGCGNRVSSGLDWVFNTVEEAIILEDDCVPHPTFFRFCDELLEKHRDDERIMAISGDNFQLGRNRGEYSYYFSRYNHCWGWGTWRRAWKYYDVEMKLWPALRGTHWLLNILGDAVVAEYWCDIFDRTFAGCIDTWDCQWLFACWSQNGFAILPNVNLVSNIGFTAEATHTKGSSRFANMPTEATEFPLRHPEFVIRDVRADRFTERHHFGINIKKNSLLGKVRQGLSTVKKKVRM